MKIKSGLWLNLKLGITNITKANFACTNLTKIVLTVKYILSSYITSFL